MDKVGSPQHHRSSRDAWNHRARPWRRRRGRRGRRRGAARHGAAAADDDALRRLWSEGRSHNTHAGTWLGSWRGFLCWGKLMKICVGDLKGFGVDGSKFVIPTFFGRSFLKFCCSNPICQAATKLVSSPMARGWGYETSGRSYTSTAFESEGQDQVEKLMEFHRLRRSFYFLMDEICVIWWPLNWTK